MSPPTPFVPLSVSDIVGNSHTVYMSQPWVSGYGANMPATQMAPEVRLVPEQYMRAPIEQPVTTQHGAGNNGLALSLSNVAQHMSLFAKAGGTQEHLPAFSQARTTPEVLTTLLDKCGTTVTTSDEHRPSTRSTSSSAEVCENDDLPEAQRAGSNLYVSNLPSTMTQSMFRLMFSSFGTIIGARLVKRRKGDAPIGFVQFTTAEMAQSAIANMDGKQVEGAYISVRLANRDKDKGIHNKPSSNLYVANLPQKVTELDLRIIFSRYGDIHSLRVLKYPNTGVSKGTALVRFVSIEDATRAKDALHCLPLHGQDLPLEVKYAETKEEKLSRRDNRANSDNKQLQQQKQQSSQQPQLPQHQPPPLQHQKQPQLPQPQQQQVQLSSNQSSSDDIFGAYRQHFKSEDQLEQSPSLMPSPPEEMLATSMDSHKSTFVPTTATSEGDPNPFSRISPFGFLPLEPETQQSNDNSMRVLTDYIKWMMHTKEENDAKSSSNTDSIGTWTTNDSPYPRSPQDPQEPLRTPPREPNTHGRQDSEDAPRHFGSPMSLADLCQQQKPIQGDVLQVSGLASSVDRLGLYELFTPHGAIMQLETVSDRHIGTVTAIVKFRNPEDAAMAQLKLNRELFQGRLLEAKLAPCRNTLNW
uniref:RRM domain-containing protein n=1 Tax=Eutreptiella gymnastica TaxID=73025 RepID=A0A7S1HS41_9EUGL